jgi:hypothetical protein
MALPWLLILPIALFAVLLCVFAFWWPREVKKQKIDRAHAVSETVAHALTAIGILTVALLYVEEKQWTPRFLVDVKSDVRSIPNAPKKAAVVQLAIAIKNEGRASQHVNLIEVAALGIRGTPTLDPSERPDLRATEFYKLRTSRVIGIGSGETEFQYVEIPVQCDWTLVRVIVKVPVPPATGRRPHGTIPVYERKLLVSLDDACTDRSTVAKSRKPTTAR